MAKCVWCGQDMLTAKGCKYIPIFHKRKEYKPIKVRDPRDWFHGGGWQCPDCGAMPGGYHHPGCSCERCPVCGGQLISCGCVDNEE